MADTGYHPEKSASLQLRLVGKEIDRIGVNLHQLGRTLLSSQELVNITANEIIKRDIPIERYLRDPIKEFTPRRFFLQGHLAEARTGSLELLIPLIAQPELRMFLTSADFRSFAISVLANLFTSANFIFAGRWTSRGTEPAGPSEAERSLAIQLAPQLEKLARCVTPRGGIEHIDFMAEQTSEGSRIQLRVARGSRNTLLDFAESAPVSDAYLTGELRSIDLDLQRATIVEAVTGTRVHLKFLSDMDQLTNLLGRSVEVRGKMRLSVDRRGGVTNRVEVDNIAPFEQLAR